MKMLKKIATALLVAASLIGFASAKELPKAKLVLAGDSTVCSFNDKYLFPRYGYGTQLSNYLSDKIEVVNCARSGRSSKSFIKETNYQKVKENLGKGDYLMIAFGHNDQKKEDTARYTNGNGSVTESDSFKYYLYEYYIKLAEEVGATPILCTPIARCNADNDYSGVYTHNTINGDYAKAIRELGKEKKVTVIDLNDATVKLYKKLGYENAKYFHAIPVGKSNTEADWASLDTTHLNIFGAKEVAYLFATNLKKSKCSLKNYLVKKIAEPKKDSDLVSNASYTFVPYKVIDWDMSSSSKENFVTESENWSGTAFGDCEETPVIINNGFVAKETEKGIFVVGQSGEVSTGKIGAKTDGISFVCQQIPSKQNFVLSAKAKVLTVAPSKWAKSSGFGLMLRDDFYLASQYTVDSNYVAAGLYSDSSSSVANFSRESSELKLSSNKADSYKVGDEVEMKIERVGQVVTVSTTFNGKTYTDTYTDFDFVAKDNAFFYCGMFGTRGTTAEFSNVNLELTGESQIN